jgi:ERCC4-type nuclease
LERYGSVENVIQASYPELVETPGIGRETAQRIRWAVSEPAAAYIPFDQISSTLPGEF